MMHAHWISKARDGTACTTVQASNGYARRQICIAAYVRATTTSRDVSQMTEQITILQTKCAVSNAYGPSVNGLCAILVHLGGVQDGKDSTPREHQRIILKKPKLSTSQLLLFIFSTPLLSCT